jgi:hypothetical protein
MKSKYQHLYLQSQILIIMILLLPACLFSQYQNIMIYKGQSADIFEAPEEVSISINPANPQNIVVGSNIYYYYFSFDGGKTWERQVLSSSFGVWGDPCLVFDLKGNLYFGHLSNPSSGYWIDRIVVQKSIDGGISWDDGKDIGFVSPKQQDKEWLAIDYTNSPFQNNIYNVWTEFDHYGTSAPEDSTRILFSKSSDAGGSWSNPLKISDLSGDCVDGSYSVMGAMPAVGPNGEIYATWGGPLGIMFDKSTDGGKNFGTDKLVNTQPGGMAYDVPGINRTYGMPSIASDISKSKYRGNIYITWADQRNGTDNTDVFCGKSTDNGETWSEAKKVNDDTTKRHQFLPWMTVDPLTGNIYVLFYDRRNTQGDTTDVYIAKSYDGGKTFINEKISGSSFTPYSNVFFGDYIGITALNGMVRPVWGRMDDGIQSIWTAMIDDTINIVSVEEKELSHDVSLSENYPNPFDDYTTISYSLPEPAHVKLSIMNSAGEVIQVIANENKPAGRYTAIWSPEIKIPGLYFYMLETGNFTEVRKCVLIR